MNDTSWLVLVGIVVVGAAVLLLSGGGSDPIGPVLAPVADAGPDRVLSECASVRVGYDGFDPTGGAVTYQWTAPRGSFDNARSLHPSYTAPTTCGFGEDVILTLTITNEHGVIARDSLVMHIRDSIPCVYSVPCPARTPCAASVRNPGRAVSSPHVFPQRTPQCAPPVPVVHPPVTAVCVPTREVRPCPVPCQAPCSTCPKPLVQTRPTICPTPCPIPCPRCPKPPVATCSVICPAQSVVEGGSIQLRGTVWDADRNLASYYWTADKGRFDDPSSINPVYYAPIIAAPYGEDVCIALTAVDSCGASTTSQIVLRIRNSN